jgi:uncharacterized protein with WD repeat
MALFLSYPGAISALKSKQTNNQYSINRKKNLPKQTAERRNKIKMILSYKPVRVSDKLCESQQGRLEEKRQEQSREIWAVH